METPESWSPWESGLNTPLDQADQCPWTLRPAPTRQMQPHLPEVPSTTWLDFLLLKHQQRGQRGSAHRNLEVKMILVGPMESQGSLKVEKGSRIEDGVTQCVRFSIHCCWH